MTYKLLKVMFKTNRDFITKLLDDIVNFRVNPAMFYNLNITPIYKTAKKEKVFLPKAFRAVSAGDVLFKASE